MPGMFQIGDQFEHYQIQAHLGQGGMADIYRAYDIVNHRDVAIKIPDATMIGDPAQYERFQRELEVSKSLRHPAILSGLDFGQHNRIPYLVTELIEGKSLRDIITASTPMPPEKAVELVRKIAEGMVYCHENSVIHRDLKPENILVTAEGQPVIIDFGLSLTKGSHRITYGSLSATTGTPDYMAPEQVEGKRGDPRTDIYALGTILFELLSGQTPFSGDNQLAVMAAHLRGSAPRLDQVQPGVSPQLAAIAAKCLQRNPADRYPSMTVLIEALDHPETADLSILERAETAVAPGDTWQIILRALGISALVLLGLAVLALILQALHP
jgi:serine/threonine protein kinase